MILCDAGPLIALTNPRDEPNHQRCRVALDGLQRPLITTWPCLTEAFHISGRITGWPAQRALWRLLHDEADLLVIHIPSPAESWRMQELMEQYIDVPMDLADASLVAAAETRQLLRVFTLDSDFRIYRSNQGDAFTIVPE